MCPSVHVCSSSSSITLSQLDTVESPFDFTSPTFEEETLAKLNQLVSKLFQTSYTYLGMVSVIDYINMRGGYVSLQDIVRKSSPPTHAWAWSVSSYTCLDIVSV